MLGESMVQWTKSGTYKVHINVQFFKNPFVNALKISTFLLYSFSKVHKCRNLTLRECEDETHTPEMGTWESSRTLKSLEFDYKGQNTLHWGVFYIIGKLLKCRCRKWTRLSHLDI
jgi:hypothetical protein